MRKSIIAVFTLSIFLICAGLAMAAVPAIFINGVGLASENAAVVEDGRTLLPMRAVFEALDQQVDWNAEDKSITSGTILMQIDSPVATVDGEEIDLDVPAKLIDGVTYVPLRFVAESLGKDVIWDGSLNRVDINDKQAAEEDADETAVEEETPADEEAAVDDDAVVDEETTEDADEEDTTEEDTTEEDTIEEDTEETEQE